MRFLNSSTLIGLGSTLLLSALVGWGLMWRIDPLQVENTPPETPTVQSRLVDLVGRHNGQQRWRLQANEAEVVRNEQVFNQGAKGFFYGNPSPEEKINAPLFRGSQELAWQAGKARYNASQDRLLLTHQVKVSSPDGDQLTTTALTVTPDKAIEVPEPFTLTGDEMTLDGKSGSFSFEFALLTANQGRMVIDPAPPSGSRQGAAGSALAASPPQPLLEAANPDPMTIIANQIKYDRKQQIAYGEGNLRIEQRDLIIQAPKGEYNRQRSQSSLSGGVTLQEVNGGSGDSPLGDFGTLVAQAPAQTAPQRQEVTIVADKLQYDRNTQIAQGEGNLEIKQGDTIIAAPRGTYKRKESQSILVGGVKLTEPERNLASERLNGNHKDKIFLFEENVLYVQKPDLSGPDTKTGSELRRSETQVKASQLLYNSPIKSAQFSGNVEFTQQGRKATASAAQIDDQEVVLTGEVIIDQIQGDWLAKRSQDPDVKAALNRPTRIFADRVVIDQATSDAQFFGNVVIVQENRAAEGDQATYTDSQQTFELKAESAPVMLCDRGDSTATPAASIEGLPGRDALDVTCRGANQIRSKLITLDMIKNTFAADGQSSMQFRVTGEDQPL